MAAYDNSGVNTTAQQSGGLSNKLGQGLIDGRVKVYNDTLACGSAITSGQTICIAGSGSTGASGGVGYLPKGATILAIIIGVNVAQTTATLSVGDGASATRYASASTVLQTANVAVVFPGNGYVIGTSNYDNWLVLTTGGASLQTTGTISISILYTTD